MTAAQQGLFLIDQIAGGTNAYNVAQVMRLRGDLDVDALRRGVDELVRRHEVLRTRFVTVAGEGGRVEILPADRADFTRVDVAEADVESYVRDVVDEPFDLGSGRLLRARLADVGPGHAVLVLVVHHIASDAPSKAILAEELSTLYAAFVEGRPSPLAPPRLQYADYAAWQGEHDPDRAELAWWRENLAGAPEQTTLPFDRVRPVRPTFRGAKLVERVDPVALSEVDAFCARRSVTTYMALLAAFTALVDRHAGQGEITVGSTVSGRHARELDDVVGLFINTVPVRVDLTGSPDFATLADRCRDASVAGLQHQDVSLESMVQEFGPHRVPGRNAFYQTMLTYKAEGNRTPRLPGLEVTLMPWEAGWSKLDLSVICVRSDDELVIVWEYSTDLFDEHTVRRMAQQMVRLLAAGVSEPARPVESLPILEATDERALGTWNETAVSGRMPMVHELLGARARETPDARAVGDATGWLTYRELDERSNQLAHRLVGLGVGPDQRVAVCMERSVDLEIAVFAILKAGGAYVPLDPGYPAERLDFMLRDCAAALLLSQSSLVAVAPAHDNTLLVDQADTTAEPATPPEVGISPEQLAYVIYTSGTTGRPKGVMIQHGGVANHVWWMTDYFGLGPGDTVLQKTPFSFDPSVWELLWTVTTGAALFMAEPHRDGDPWYLSETVQAQQISVIVFVPSMLRAFLDAGVAASCRSLRSMISCGERLPDDVRDRCLEVLPWVEMVNLYGPTEASVCVTYEACVHGTTGTVGRPMANCQIRVLDLQGGQVPIGMPGEIHVGGAQLARGYLARPELTHDKFLDTDFGRLYRTGDRGRWRPDGKLEYLGRLDDQVKLRGQRIELGEIESVLASHDGVDAACCVVARAPSGEDLLAAYVVAADPEAPEDALVTALLGLAGSRLPSYMIPASISLLPQLPVNPSGKLDRRALASREVRATEGRMISPSTDTEARIERIWREQLRLEEPISTDASFFDIGGSSMVALRVFPILEREFQTKLALAVLFDNVTIASLAAFVDDERDRDAPWETLVSVQPRGDRTPLFAFPELRGSAVLYRQMAPHFASNRPVLAVEALGLDGRHAPRSSIEEIAADAVLAIRQRQPHGPYFLMGFCFGGVTAYEAGVQLARAGEEVAFVGLIDATPLGRGSESRLSKLRRARRHSLRTWYGILSQRYAAYRRVYVARVLARFDRPIPASQVDIIGASVRALRRYVAPDSDLSVTLYRMGSENGHREGAVLQRWSEVAGHAELHLLEGRASHVDIVKGDAARQIAHAVNATLSNFG